MAWAGRAGISGRYASPAAQGLGKPTPAVEREGRQERGRGSGSVEDTFSKRGPGKPQDEDGCGGAGVMCQGTGDKEECGCAMGAQYPDGSSVSAMWFACLLYCAVLCIASHHAVHDWAGLGRLAMKGYQRWC